MAASTVKLPKIREVRAYSKKESADQGTVCTIMRSIMYGTHDMHLCVCIVWHYYFLHLLLLPLFSILTYQVQTVMMWMISIGSMATQRQ